MTPYRFLLFSRPHLLSYDQTPISTDPFSTGSHFVSDWLGSYIQQIRINGGRPGCVQFHRGAAVTLHSSSGGHHLFGVDHAQRFIADTPRLLRRGQPIL